MFQQMGHGTWDVTTNITLHHNLLPVVQSEQACNLWLASENRKMAVHIQRSEGAYHDYTILERAKYFYKKILLAIKVFCSMQKSFIKTVQIFLMAVSCNNKKCYWRTLYTYYCSLVVIRYSSHTQPPLLHPSTGFCINANYMNINVFLTSSPTFLLIPMVTQFIKYKFSQRHYV